MSSRILNEEAQRQLLTESIWLRRAVDAALHGTPVSGDALIRRGAIGSSRERFRDGHLSANDAFAIRFSLTGTILALSCQ